MSVGQFIPGKESNVLKVFFCKNTRPNREELLFDEIFNIGLQEFIGMSFASDDMSDVELELECLNAELNASKSSLLCLDESFSRTEDQLEDHRSVLYDALYAVTQQFSSHAASLKNEIECELQAISLYNAEKERELLTRNKLQAIISMHNLRLERFSARVCFVLNSALQTRKVAEKISYHIVSREKNANELHRIQKKLGAAKSITSVIRFSREEASSHALHPVTIRSQQEVSSLLGSLLLWAQNTAKERKSKQSIPSLPLANGQQSSDGDKECFFPSDQLILVNSIRWLHPESASNPIWNVIQRQSRDSGSTLGPLDELLGEYFLRHSACLSSAYLYYCLENTNGFDDPNSQHKILNVRP